MTTLKDSIRYFVHDSHILASLSVSFGINGKQKTVRGGCMDERGTPVSENTIYDIASLSKLFTSLCVMQLCEKGALDLSAPVTLYAPQFTHLRDLSVRQVLGFSEALKTDGRLDDAPCREDALNLLFSVHHKPNEGLRAYSDMHSMVLKYVIEGASRQKIFSYIRENILDRLHMTRTFSAVPESELQYTASFDGEHRLEKGKWVIHRGVLPGMPHDPKARLLSPHGEDFCGHAGIFSCEKDMIALCRGVLDEKIISRKSLEEMTVNRTGCLLAPNVYRHFLGYQCYLRHPQQRFSEVPAYMGDHAFALSGFTGQHLSIDYENGIFALFLGNRCMNRLSVCLPEEGKALEDYGLAPDHTGCVLSPDGYVWSSVQYVYQKDARLHDLIANELHQM